jgi:hypothetical protein
MMYHHYEPTMDERLREAMALRVFEAVAKHAEHSFDPDVLRRVAVSAAQAMKAGLEAIGPAKQPAHQPVRSSGVCLTGSVSAPTPSAVTRYYGPNSACSDH